MEIAFEAPYHTATYLGESNEVWTKGNEYTIHIQKMKDGRYQLFKSLHHFREEPGHKVYKDLEQIKQTFNVTLWTKL